MNNIKKILFCFISALMLLSVFQSGIAADSVSLKPFNQVVAIVNNETITSDQLNTKVNLVVQQLKAEKQPLPPMTVLTQQVLQQMIDDMLQLQIATQTGIRATQAEINDVINRIAKQNNQDINAFYAALSKQGFTIKAFRKEIANEVIIQKLQRREVADRVSVSQQEVDDFIRYNLKPGKSMPEYHVAVILVGLSSSPSTSEIIAAESRAKSIVLQLKNGESFKQLAASQSSGKTALQGGDIGWHKLAEMPTVLTSVLPKMKVGEISDPMRTVTGFEIVKVLAKRQSAESSKSQRLEVEQSIFQRQFQEDLAIFLSRLRSQAYIKVLLN